MDLDHHTDRLHFLIRDRDTKFAAERWFGTVRRECTHRILIVNE